MASPSPDELRARVALRIREIAKRKGMPLTQVADAAGISRRHMWIVLRGESAASLDILAKLAAALGVDPSALVRPYRGKPPAPPAED